MTAGGVTAADSLPAAVRDPESRSGPRVTGDLRLGRTLTCDPGTWDAVYALEYAWLRDGVEASTGAQRVNAVADVGHLIQCRVSAIGRTAATSAGVSPTPPEVRGLPTLEGDARLGRTLTCTGGDWDDTYALTYQWLRDDTVIATGPALHAHGRRRRAGHPLPRAGRGPDRRRLAHDLPAAAALADRARDLRRPAPGPGPDLRPRRLGRPGDAVRRHLRLVPRRRRRGDRRDVLRRRRGRRPRAALRRHRGRARHRALGARHRDRSGTRGRAGQPHAAGPDRGAAAGRHARMRRRHLERHLHDHPPLAPRRHADRGRDAGDLHRRRGRRRAAAALRGRRRHGRRAEPVRHADAAGVGQRAGDQRRPAPAPDPALLPGHLGRDVRADLPVVPRRGSDRDRRPTRARRRRCRRADHVPRHRRDADHGAVGRGHRARAAQPGGPERERRPAHRRHAELRPRRLGRPARGPLRDHLPLAARGPGRRHRADPRGRRRGRRARADAARRAPRARPRSSPPA